MKKAYKTIAACAYCELLYTRKTEAQKYCCPECSERGHADSVKLATAKSHERRRCVKEGLSQIEMARRVRPVAEAEIERAEKARKEYAEKRRKELTDEERAEQACLADYRRRAENVTVEELPEVAPKRDPVKKVVSLPYTLSGWSLAKVMQWSDMCGFGADYGAFFAAVSRQKILKGRA